MRLLRKCFATIRTFKPFLSQMYSFVPFEICFVCKQFFTNITLKRFLTRMHSLMDPQMYFLRKVFVTRITFKRFVFTCMQDLVPFQISHTTKGLLAYTTFENITLEETKNTSKICLYVIKKKHASRLINFMKSDLRRIQSICTARLYIRQNVMGHEPSPSPVYQ